MRLTNEQLKYARDWLIDCYPNDEDVIDDALAQDIESHVDREFVGGIDAFIKTCEVA
jgi:hypothetical protein